MTQITENPLKDELFTYLPPLGQNERLSKFFILDPDSPALSTTPRPNYYFNYKVELYVPIRHKPIADAVSREMNVTKHSHGTEYASKQGCGGQLCRRAVRHRKKVTASTVYRHVEPLLYSFQIFYTTGYPPSHAELKSRFPDLVS